MSGNRTPLFVLASAVMLAISGCAAITGQSSSVPIKVHLEFWDPAASTSASGGGCVLTPYSLLMDQVSRAETITLVGPDDAELATANFGRGRYGKTSETDTDFWTEIPTQDVCIFEADFGEVPRAATYRLKYRGRGISDLAYSPDELAKAGNTLTVIFGGQIRD